MLYLVLIKKFKNLCNYLASAYPEEWEKLSRNSMGTSKGAAIRVNLEESLKSGYFSTLTDEKVIKFQNHRTVLSNVMAGVVLLQITLIFLW